MRNTHQQLITRVFWPLLSSND